MSIKFASICPHPPIIIPSVGSDYDLEKSSDTIEAMEKLAKDFKEKDPDTVIVISPHGPVSYDKMTISISPTLSGNLETFGDYKTKMSFKNDLELVDILQKKAREQEIPTRIEDVPNLDHGCLVPLYYLIENYTKERKEKLKVVLVAYSFLDRKTHFQFGKKIFKACNSKELKNKNIAIVASGDLSHRLTPEAPAGYSSKGEEFDKKLIQLLIDNNVGGILNMDQELIKQAGECGYLSIIILLGVLSKIKKTKFKILSYQGPFGVGYLVANVKGL